MERWLRVSTLISRRIKSQPAVSSPVQQTRTTRSCSPIAMVWADKVDQSRVDSIIFEHCDEPLSARWSRQAGVFEPAMIALRVSDAVHGLAHMHTMGAARRDLKMDDMRLKARADGAARLKLADFGLCREMGHERMDASLAYAKLCVYRPPEIVLGQKYALSADTSALGVLSRQLLTARQVWANPWVAASQTLAAQCCMSLPFPRKNARRQLVGFQACPRPGYTHTVGAIAAGFPCRPPARLLAGSGLG